MKTINFGLCLISFELFVFGCLGLGRYFDLRQQEVEFRQQTERQQFQSTENAAAYKTAVFDYCLQSCQTSRWETEDTWLNECMKFCTGYSTPVRYVYQQTDKGMWITVN